MNLAQHIKEHEALDLDQHIIRLIREHRGSVGSGVAVSTNEEAQDAVGNILVDTATIDFTYDDATPQITADVIDDSITNVKLANMAQATIKGRAAAAGTGDPTDLTAAQVATIINSSLDHGTLAGLADDDHSQYALLAGRAGGQTLVGGTASGEDLTLSSTAHATKGSVFIGSSSLFEFDQTTGQLKLPTSGSGAGLLINDVQAYRTSQNKLAIEAKTTPAHTYKGLLTIDLANDWEWGVSFQVTNTHANYIRFLSPLIYSNDVSMIFGDGTSVIMYWNTTTGANDYMAISLLTVNSTGGAGVLLLDKGITNGPIAVATALNPTLQIHADSTNTSLYMRLYHDQTDAIINAGSGQVVLQSAGVEKFRTLSGGAQVTGALTVTTNLTVTGGTSTLATLAGTLDAGGATSFEIPNGAGGTTVDAAGEVTVDTTSRTLNFYDGTAEVVLEPLISKAFFLETPVAADDLPIFRTDKAMTLVKVVYGITGGTNWVGQLQEADDAQGTNGADTQAADSTVTGNTTVTSFSNASFDAGDYVRLKTTSVSGSVTWLHVTFYFRTNP